MNIVILNVRCYAENTHTDLIVAYTDLIAHQYLFDW